MVEILKNKQIQHDSTRIVVFIMNSEQKKYTIIYVHTHTHTQIVLNLKFVYLIFKVAMDLI